MNIIVYSLKDKPEMKTGEIMKSVWPKFMTPNNYSMKYWSTMRKLFPEYQICICIDDVLVGIGNSLPIPWSGQLDDLPTSWTDTLVRGVENGNLISVNTLAAVNIAIHPEYQKLGLSQMLLQELKQLSVAKGLTKMVVPVRPSFKADYPLACFDKYIYWKRKDGTPFDPWIRTHWKLGATIIKPILKAFTTQGGISEWEDWTGLEFPESGSYIVKGALQPIIINKEQDIGTYDDPNVWMEYSSEIGFK
ncbi:hypothetical protein AMS62_19640 [Bacillus sp. FJAT-18019]|nr:hypothetical protein AMS62_19640 [Bacillus sp. FJAT-18019]